MKPSQVEVGHFTIFLLQNSSCKILFSALKHFIEGILSLHTIISSICNHLPHCIKFSNASACLISWKLLEDRSHVILIFVYPEDSSCFLSSVQLLSCVQLFATPWTAAHQACLSINQLPEIAQTHVHCIGDAIQPSHPLSSPSPPVFKLSQHQGLFKWVSSSHQVAKVLEFQLQHQSFQWTPRTDFP